MKKSKVIISLLIILFICALVIIILLEKNINYKNIANLKFFISPADVTTNTWDISIDNDGSVIATLSEDGTLTISGKGKMKDWQFNSDTDWHNEEVKKLIKKVVIEQGVTNIGTYAFYICSNLTNVEIPDGVTVIGNGAFSSCESLTDIIIPEGVTSIGDSAFSCCNSLIHVIIPKGVTSIGNEAFISCENLLNLKIEEGVKSIGDKAFQFCDKLENVTIFNGLISIGYRAFAQSSSLKNVILPDSVKYIGDSAFFLTGNARIICKSNSTAETYAKMNELDYKIDDMEPIVELSKNGTTEAIRQRNITITVSDNVSGIESIKYSWTTKTEKLEENEITNELSQENPVITTPKETGEYYLWVLAKDNLGNQTIVKSNPFILDNTEPTINVEYTTNTYTKDNVIVKVKANEEVQEIEGWTLSSDKKILTKEYTENTEETITVQDMVGNETIENIQIDKIDKEKPTIELSINGTTEAIKLANITVGAKDNLSGIKSIKYLWSTKVNVEENEIINELSQENPVISTPTETGEYYLWILVEDNVENKTTLISNLFIIDTTEPQGEVTYNLAEDKKSCLVTIKANEEVQEIEGWILSDDRRTLTKEYDENTEEIITMKDKVGNITDIEIKTTGIIEPIFNVKTYKIKGTYIRNISPKTIYENFIKNIEANQSYVVKEEGNAIQGSELIKTGQELIIGKRTYTLVVGGDINGDGEVKLSDLSALKMHLIGKRSLTGASTEAGDINDDGEVKLSDLSKIKKIIIDQE